MLAMVLVATALTRFTLAHTGVISDEDRKISQGTKKLYIEEDMTPEFSEQLYRHEHDSDVRRTRDDGFDKYGPVQILQSPSRKLKRRSVMGDKTDKSPSKHRIEAVKMKLNGTAPNATKEGEVHKKRAPHGEDMDVVDREDHVTQYLAELLVNTDSEITSLQASENDEDREMIEMKEDTFFAFVTGQEKVQEVEGAWSRPADDDYQENKKEALKDPKDFHEYLPNIVIDDIL